MKRRAESLIVWIAATFASGCFVPEAPGTHDAVFFLDGSDSDDTASDASRGCVDGTLMCDAPMVDIADAGDVVAADAGHDVVMDTGTDVATDAGTDAPIDVQVLDPGIDAVDTVVDVAIETGADASSTDGGLAGLCTSSGGTVTTGLCCASTVDFPNGCTTGACGCSPTSSHTVMTCQCGTALCFDPTMGCR